MHEAQKTKLVYPSDQEDDQKMRHRTGFILLGISLSL